MDWKEFITDYFSFSRKDRLGIIVLLSLLGLIFLGRKLTHNSNGGSGADEQITWLNSPAGRKFLDSIKARSNYIQQRAKPERTSIDRSYEKPYFNSSKRRELKRSSFYEYKKDRTTSVDQHGVSSIRAGPTPFQYPFSRLQTEEIDVNDADSSMFIALPGIGSKLAARILKFRERLGGFYSIEQIGETFGLPDSTFQKIRKYLKLRDTSVKKININTAGEDELKSHPYIRWNITNPIISYRNEHGPFQKLEDLKNVVAVTEEIYGRILPYLTIE